MYFVAAMLLQLVLLCVFMRKSPYLHFTWCPVCSVRHWEHVPQELLFNFSKVHSLFGMKRMLPDSLKWTLFHSPLNSERPPLCCTRAVWKVCVYCICVCVLFGGWGSDCDLEMPSVPLKTTLSSPDQSNTVPQGPLMGSLRFTRSTSDRLVVKSQLCSPALLRRVLKALCTWPT